MWMAFLIAGILTFSGQLPTTQSEAICSQYCDGRDPSLATNPRSPVSTTVWFREIKLHISDVDNMAFASIENGDPGDELWLDRSFNGGVSWTDGSRLGDTVIPSGSRDTSTLMYNVDGDITQQQIGALRACGKANDRPEIACTPWARSTVHAESWISAGATALMQFYKANGLFETTGWWNSANCLTALIDYIKMTGSMTYFYAIDHTFETCKDDEGGDFTNMYIDDTGWWGLAWIGAYDLTGNEKYLEMAKIDADYMYATKDALCGGGIYWTTRLDHKNAIPNELFIKLAASLHNRIPGDTKYLNEALEIWTWFEGIGVINSDHLVNDGINTHSDCKNNGQTTWTYNQGVILGGLKELYDGTGDIKYLNRGREIADAVIASSYLNPGGILREPCETNGCGADGATFKGVFVRNLGEFNRALIDKPYAAYLQNLVNVIHDQDRNDLNQFGLHYAGPLEAVSAATHQSGFEALVAAIV